MVRLVNRWAVLRIESFNAFVQFAAAMFTVSAKGTVNPAMAGVSLNLVLSVGGMLGAVVMMATELQNRMNRYVS